MTFPLTSRTIPPGRAQPGAWARYGFVLLFLACSLPSILILSLAVPPGEVADEQAHIARADSVRHGELAGRRAAIAGGGGQTVVVRIDLGAMAAAFPFLGARSVADKQWTATVEAREAAVPWQNRLAAASVPNTGTYPPLLYLPAAAAIQAAKQAGDGPAAAIVVARLANGLCYVALGAAALWLAPRGRPLLLVLLGLPMSLSLAGSVNQDGLAIGLAALAAALVPRGTRRSWTLGTLVLAVLVMAKPFLLPFTLLPAACLPGRWTARRAAGAVLLAAAPAIVWGGLVAAFVATPFVRGPPAAAGPLWPGPPGTLFASTSPAEQVRVFLAVPSRLLTLPLGTLYDAWPGLWRSFLGVLGTLDLPLPEWFYQLWIAAAAGATLACLLGPRRDARGLAGNAGLLMLGGLTVWLVFVLQYLSWTTVGLAAVEGVQGRYFIPGALLMAPFGLAPALPILARVRGLLVLPAVAALLMEPGMLLMTVLHGYYVR